jgi:hypothetical protein
MIDLVIQFTESSPIEPGLLRFDDSLFRGVAATTRYGAAGTAAGRVHGDGARARDGGENMVRGRAKPALAIPESQSHYPAIAQHHPAFH